MDANAGMLKAMNVAETMTAKELTQLSFPDKQVELLRGRLVVREPPGTWHGVVAGRSAYYVADFVLRNDLGVVLPQNTGFKIGADPDTVRAPDLAFVAGDRQDAIPEQGYAELVPDLVVEIVSPSDRPGEILAKIADWLTAGTRLVWLVDPLRRETQVFRPDGSVSLLTADESLDGEDVLPGFSCPLSALLAR